MEAARIARTFVCCLLLYHGMTPLHLACAQDLQPPRKVEPDVEAAAPPKPSEGNNGAALPRPLAEPGEELYPINLPAAMRLGNARAWDIRLAMQQLRIASAQLAGARVLWLPSLIGGVDWTHHDGPVQNITTGQVSPSTYSSLYSGMAPLAVFASTDAIFSPLAMRQVTRAQDANVQTATNDTLTALASAYFDAVEASADLAAMEDVVKRLREAVQKAIGLAPEYIPELEVARVSAALASAEEVREIARQRWRVNSAEVARLIRLKPTVLIAPMESPELQVTIVPPDRTLDQLVDIAIRSRPEMTYNEALVQAAQHRVRQEKTRPFLPIFLIRGAGTQVPFPMAFGVFGGGTGGTLNNFNVRSDWDLQAIWMANNLGLGNRALIRQRVEERELARIEAFKVRDIIAKEVTQTWAELRSAFRRVGQAKRELEQALISADKNLKGLGEVKRPAGNIVILVIRPLEVVAALQALNQAYYHYFGAIADYNRTQFELYRALGNPAQILGDDKKPLAPPPPSPTAAWPNLAKQPAPPPGGQP